MSRTVILSLALLAACLLASQRLAAQRSDPFSTLEILAGPSTDLGVGRLADYWRSNTGVFVRLATPFHFGEAAAAVQRTSFSTRSPDQPDFRLLAASVEWNADLPAGRFGRLFGGVQAGSVSMHFLDNDDIVGNEDENEFLAGVQGGWSIPVGRGLGATVMLSHRKVFTRIPMRLTSASAGVHLVLPTPRRLREILE